MKRKLDTQNATRGVSAAPRFFTISDIADFLGVSPRSVRRWVKLGDLPVHRFGAVVRISDVDFRAFAATHREG
jgi:excisionase family DNA binding protein